ncbi:MAG: cell division protein SepF, partial [Clostridiales bacterium]|nr:cell division protein SepF [Clostridiales bacterium]
EEPEEIERIYYKDIRTYEDCKVLIDNYKDGAVCILSLDPAQIADVQGMMNYACGGVYALDGVVEKVGENVFMTIPRKEEG